MVFMESAAQHVAGLLRYQVVHPLHVQVCQPVVLVQVVLDALSGVFSCLKNIPIP